MKILKHINTTYIIVSLVSLAVAVSPLEISLTTQIILFFIGSLVVGLPHGALDYEVAKHLGLCTDLWQTFFFFFGYLFVACLNLALWLWIPMAGFLFFLTLSIWHFGEDWDISDQQFKRFNTINRICFGASFVCLPTIYHGPAVEHLFSFLIGIKNAQLLVEYMQYFAVPLLVVAALFLLFNTTRKGLKRTLMGAVFLLSGVILPPIMFLFLYFCFLHAPRHTLELYNILEYKNLYVMLKKQIPIMFLTIILLIVGFLYYHTTLSWDQAIFSTLIIVIACLTTPHMLLIEYLSYKKNDKRLEVGLG